MSRLVLHLFGSPRVEVAGVPIEVDTRKATALLAYLAVTGETHQRDSLAALLWPDYDQTSARAALRRTLSTLNRALEEKNSACLDVTRESIGLVANADIWLDVKAFQQGLAALRDHGHVENEICAECLEALDAAVALYREPFMAGFNLRDSPDFEEWQFFQEETLRRELSGALEKQVVGLSACGRTDPAITAARRWLALDTLNEEAHRRLMLLFNQAGQRNAALRQYRECVRILDQELGVAPLDETTRLYQAILNREEIPAAEGRLHFRASPQPGASQSAAVPEAAPAPLASEPAPSSGMLVGREAELSQLKKAHHAILADGCFAAIEGEAGIGKTRLAETFLDWARAAGSRIIQSRCYAGEDGLAYAPFISGLGAATAQPSAAEALQTVSPAVLAEAGRLLPELLNQAPAAAAPAGDGAQARFFEALRQVIQALLLPRSAGDPSGILFLDDLHWADTASLDLLAYLARRLKGTKLLLLAAWRNEPDAHTQALDRLTGELSRAGQAVRISLKRLGAAQMIDLVRTYPGAPMIEGQVEALGQRLFEESEGLPFVAVEYLAALSAREPLAEITGQWEMPASVRDLLHSRLAGLDAAAKQILSTAAVIGHSFDLDTLREVSGRGEMETVDGLDRLLATRLVMEQAGPEHPGEEIRYDFTQEKLRALIYEETSLARRRLLHRRTADALARLPASHFENPALVGYHYEQAGLANQAAAYHYLAGERARRLFANVEALAHFQAALACGHPDAAGLHEAIGDLHTLRGEYAAALTSYETAAALCSPGCLANLEHKLGNVHHRLGEWDLAESHYQASLEAAGEPSAESALETGFYVHLFADRALVAHARGDIDAALSLANRALELAQPAGDAHALAQVYNVFGVLARARGDTRAAIAALEASLDASRALGDPLARIAALNNLALVYGENNQLEEAVRLARQALDLCQKRGDRHREAALHNNLADLLHQAGHEEEAMEQMKQAVVIFAEIGAPAVSAQPEIWKLTEW